MKTYDPYDYLVEMDDCALDEQLLTDFDDWENLCPHCEEKCNLVGQLAQRGCIIDGTFECGHCGQTYQDIMYVGYGTTFPCPQCQTPLRGYQHIALPDNQTKIRFGCPKPECAWLGFDVLAIQAEPPHL